MSVRPAESVSAPSRARSNTLLALIRLVPLLIWTIICHTGQLLGRFLQPTLNGKRAVAAIWTHRWFRGMAAILGIRIGVVGEKPRGGALIAPNHIGYADIIVIGAVVECLFVAKFDVTRWPIIGHLFSTSDQVAVPRARSRDLASAVEAIAERLRGGQSVCVFLEGTSTGGDRVLPFHGALVEAAIAAEAPVVPVGMNWRATGRGVSIAEDVAYWKDHKFAHHVWRLIGLRGIEVEIRFGRAIPARGDRKQVAERLHGMVLELVELPRGG